MGLRGRRRSTDSATTSIGSGTPPVPLPHQREAGFQRMPCVFGKPRLDLGLYRSDQIVLSPNGSSRRT